jgi:phosphonate transport system substrate-binding protein
MKLNFLFFMVVLLAQQTIAQTSVSFYLTPSISAQELKTHGNLIKEYLTKETGLNIDLKIPTSYDNLVEDFGKNKSCFAFMSSQSYVLANEKYKASVRLRIVRYGHSTYQGMIVTHVSSGIKKLADLENKSFAYTDALSTSGYLYPKMMMQRANVNPSKEVYLSKHDEVIRQVYEKKVQYVMRGRS